MRYGVSGMIALPFFLRFVPMRDWPRHAVLACVGGLAYLAVRVLGLRLRAERARGVFVNAASRSGPS